MRCYEYHLRSRRPECPYASGSEQHISAISDESWNGNLITPNPPSRAASPETHLDDLLALVEEVPVVRAADQELPQLRSDAPKRR